MPLVNDHFECHSARDAEEAVVVVGGEVDLAAVWDLWWCIEEIRGDRWPLTIDMSGVTFIDSAGVHLLVRAHQAQQAIDRPFVVRSPSPEVMSVLRITGLDTVFDIERDGSPVP